MVLRKTKFTLRKVDNLHIPYENNFSLEDSNMKERFEIFVFDFKKKDFLNINILVNVGSSACLKLQ